MLELLDLVKLPSEFATSIRRTILHGDKAPETTEEHPAEMAARLNILIKVEIEGVQWVFDGRETDGG